jgi:hypothetical protein
LETEDGDISYFHRGALLYHQTKNNNYDRTVSTLQPTRRFSHQNRFNHQSNEHHSEHMQHMHLEKLGKSWLQFRRRWASRVVVEVAFRLEHQPGLAGVFQLGQPIIPPATRAMNDARV